MTLSPGLLRSSESGAFRSARQIECLMSDGTAAAAADDGRGCSRPADTYAALDLGTNNCRLLIASPAPDGFRILEAYSRIVRLGEGLTHTGRLNPLAME